MPIDNDDGYSSDSKLWLLMLAVACLAVIAPFKVLNNFVKNIDKKKIDKELAADNASIEQLNQAAQGLAKTHHVRVIVDYDGKDVTVVDIGAKNKPENKINSPAPEAVNELYQKIR